MKKIFIKTLLICSVLSFNNCAEENQCTNSYPNSTCDNDYPLLSTFQDPRDGTIYSTTTIGNQIWFAENLKYDTLNNWTNPNNNCNLYGTVYDWNSATKACPPGWHLPTVAEFDTLLNFCGSSVVSASKLKSTSGWEAVKYSNTDIRCGNGTNEFGFNVFPTSYYDISIFKNLHGDNAQLWSSSLSPTDSINASILILSKEGYGFTDIDSWIAIGLPCRCIKD